MKTKKLETQGKKVEIVVRSDGSWTPLWEFTTSVARRAEAIAIIEDSINNSTPFTFEVYESRSGKKLKIYEETRKPDYFTNPFPSDREKAEKLNADLVLEKMQTLAKAELRSKAKHLETVKRYPENYEYNRDGYVIEYKPNEKGVHYDGYILTVCYNGQDGDEPSVHDNVDTARLSQAASSLKDHDHTFRIRQIENATFERVATLDAFGDLVNTQFRVMNGFKKGSIKSFIRP